HLRPSKSWKIDRPGRTSIQEIPSPKQRVCMKVSYTQPLLHVSRGTRDFVGWKIAYLVVIVFDEARCRDRAYQHNKKHWRDSNTQASSQHARGLSVSVGKS